MADKLSPKQIEDLFLQIRTINHYLSSLGRRLTALKPSIEEPDLADCLNEASETVNYLSVYLHDRLLKNSQGGWRSPFEGMVRPENKLRRLK